jgi:hypothetical protein
LEDIDKSAIIVKEKIEEVVKDKIVLIQHAELSEVIPRHIEIKIGGDSVLFMYEPIACHSYNKINVESNKNDVNVGTIDTLLSFYLAFLYSKKRYYNKDRILCMAMFLFNVQQKNRLSQSGLLKRFTIDCYGKQKLLEDVRTEKALKFKELLSKRGTPEYDEWFLKYNPNEQRKNVVKQRKQTIVNNFVLSPMMKRVKKTTVLTKKIKMKKTLKRKNPKKKEKNDFLF